MTEEQGGKVEASGPIEGDSKNGEPYPRHASSESTSNESGKTDGRRDTVLDRGLPVTVIVHVAGAVKEPGVYSLAEGARIKDAVDAAGGPVPEAAVHFLNLAELLTDGQKIYVPTTEEVKRAQRGEEQVASGGGHTGGVSGTSILSMPTGGSGPGGNLPKVNINTATVEQLDSLPGIGPILAERIVRSRSEEGPFSTVDDLKRVRGIGEGLLKELKNLITVK
ncbi:MAG TPA: ComEA family DNA-binding protein [Clostridia bacterium]|nr:ComEA family DNA-binding protein [Clostridia bacterium]